MKTECNIQVQEPGQGKNTLRRTRSWWQAISIFTFVLVLAACTQQHSPAALDTELEAGPTLSSQALRTTLTIVDSGDGGNIGGFPDMVLDSQGNPVIAYPDANNGTYKLAYCDNPTCSSPTFTTVNPVGGRPTNNSLVLNSSGIPVIAVTSGGVKLAICNDLTCANPTLKALGSSFVGSLVLNSAGHPMVSFYVGGGGGLKLAVCNDSICTNPTITTVDSGNVGTFSSLALNSSGNPVISYYDEGNSDLKLAVCNDLTCTNPTITTIESKDFVGEMTSLALDSNDNPVISYRRGNGTGQGLRLAVCHDPTCTNPTIKTLDSLNNAGWDSSLALDSNERPVISYTSLRDYNLKLAHCSDKICTNVTLTTVDPAPRVGRFSSLVLDSNDNPIISYYDQYNGDLKLAHCVNPDCSNPPDNTPPVITPTITGTLGDNDWYTSDVTVSWNIVEEKSVVASSTGCDEITVDTDTEGTTLTCEASSDGGTASESIVIKRDATAPEVNVTGVEDGTTYALGAVPTASCDTQDSLSGVVSEASVSLSGANSDGSGTLTATCEGALDLAGNPATTVSVSYFVEVVTPTEPILTGVLAVDYDPGNDLYISVGVGPTGEIDVYTGQHKGWTKLQENRDIDNRFTAEEFVDFAIGGETAAMYGVAIGNNQDGGGNADVGCTSINAREFSNKPYFGDGAPKQIGDMTECLAIAYDPSLDNYLVIGKDATGDIDTYYGVHNNWTQIREDFDASNTVQFGSSELIDFAIGATSGLVAVDGGDNALSAPLDVNFRADAPYRFRGAVRVASGFDFKDALAVTYDPGNDLFVYIGANASSKLDVYTGWHQAWSKLQENRDIDNRYTPEQFQDVAIGDGDSMYGVVVGNIPNYKVGWRQYAPRGTSINAREFSNKPWFGDGKPGVIGE